MAQTERIRLQRRTPGCDPLGWEDPLEEGMAALENPRGQRSLAGCSPWGPKESGRTEEAQYSVQVIAWFVNFSRDHFKSVQSENSEP